MATFNGVNCEIVFDVILPMPAKEEEDRPGFWKESVLGEWSGKATFANKTDFKSAKETDQNQVNIVGEGSSIEIYGTAISTRRNDDLLTINFAGSGMPLTKEGTPFF